MVATFKGRRPHFPQVYEEIRNVIVRDRVVRENKSLKRQVKGQTNKVKGFFSNAEFN